MIKKYVNLCLILLFLLSVLFEPLSGSDTDVPASNSQRRLLRKKRFLVFPEGSSLQLLFDWVVPVIGMPNVFTIGITAALAWQLPHDPYAPFRRPAEVIHRRVDTIKKKPSQGWITKNKTSQNEFHYSAYYPSYIKSQKKHYEQFHNNKLRIVSYKPEYEFYKPVNYNTMLSSPAYRNSLGRRYYRNGQTASYRNLLYKEAHRTTRRDLFSKVEKFLNSFEQDGRACLLKIVCQVSQIDQEAVGSFWQEILKTIFRNRSSQVGEEDEYDLAANKGHNCSDIYPKCGFY